MIIGSKIVFIENLPSTNTYAANLLKDNDPHEGTVIHTNYQLAGRGQLNNKWESEDSKNLLISIILTPAFIRPTDQFYISMTISTGICDFLKRYISDYSIKWPNDIYSGNDKIAGILIENSIMGEIIKNTVAGIGLNINQDLFLSDAPNPVSLRMLTGKQYDLNTCLKQLTSDIDKRYKQLITGDHDSLKAEYLLHLYRINEWHDYRDKNSLFSGRIRSVTNNGSLLIENRSGKVIEYAHKEVEFIP